MTGDSDGLLRAGALVPPDATPGEPADPVVARRYRHPALGDRPVVRLVAEPLGRAEDLALAFLGMELDSTTGPVALVRRQALGFPGWVLLHHPEDADYALAIVEATESLARLARSRPGAVKDGYEAIARRLSRAVPHFLPTYFEQAGRAFLEAGNPGQAGVMFGKAREAERIYALEVDEERRLAVFLEFALAGALTARSLADYAQQLSESGDPTRAYATFRRLCVERTRAGVPPWSEMATQLRRLAAAAGVDTDAEERALLAELLDAPALTRAPIGFWRAYRRPLLDLARESAAVRGTLLDRPPASPGIHDWWLSLLDAAGALDALTGPAGTVDAAAAPRGGPAAWLARTLVASTANWRSPGAPDALFALLPRMARRLRADGATVRLRGRDDWQTDLDLLDLALELQLPLEAPGPDTRLHLARWLGRPAARRRHLDHLAHDPQWGALLLQAVDDELGRTPAARLLEEGHLRRAFSAWLDLVADRIERGGLPDLLLELSRLGKVLDPEALEVNPDARDRILGADAAMSLARTLRGGSLDELGWPALEEARAGLGATITATGCWPNVVLSDGVRAVVVAPDGIVLEHDLRTGGTRHLRQISFLHAGGQLLVSWWVPAAGRRAYWSGRPAEVFDPRSLPTSSWAAPLGLSLELPDGSRTTGGRAVRAGDTAGGAPSHMASDGIRCWTLVEGRFHELDPATGRTGRRSLPAFLSGFDVGDRLVADSSWVMPLPEGMDGGPLGSRDGMVGVRVRRMGDGTFEAEGTDGRRMVARLPEAPVALVTFPGDPAPRPLTNRWHRLELWDAEGRHRLLQATALEPGPDLARATALVLPPPYWVALRPRDQAGSAALRALADETARELVAAPDHEKAVETLLPEITHPGLRRSVAAQAEVAAGARQRVEKLLSGLRGTERVPTWGGDRALLGAFAGFGVAPFAHNPPPGTTALRQLGMVERFMESGELPRQFITSPLQWGLLAGRMAAAGYLAAGPATRPEQRAVILAWLERWAGSIFCEHPDWFRLLQAVEGPDSRLSSGAWVRYRGGHRWFISPAQTAYRQPTRRLVLERSQRGAFEVPPGMAVEWERPGGGAWETPDRLRRLVALVHERGPVPWVPERVEELVARTGLTSAEAALLLGGLPLDSTLGRDLVRSPVPTALGLRPADVAAARDRLAGVPARWRIEMVAAAMPEDPADLWQPHAPGDPDGPAARIAAVWLAAFGRRAEELDDSGARASLRLLRPRGRMLAGFVDPDGDSTLNADASWLVNPQGQLLTAPGSPTDPFGGWTLWDVSLLLPWLFAARPVGDRARSGAPEVLRRVRARLANPDLLVSAGWAPGDAGGRALLEVVQSPPYRPGRGTELPGSRDTGGFVLVPARSESVLVYGRPARLPAAAEAGLLPLLGSAAAVLSERVRFLRGEGADELVARILDTPVPAGAWEANPAASAPALLAEVVAARGLSPGAAVLYLQLLAGPDPSVRRIREWNGWTGAEFGRAAAELTEAGLVVRARRARAGRDVFLPGPWEDLKAPDQPVETWRLRLYGGRPLGRLLALRPLHRLFEDAWHEVAAGRGPAFEEVSR